MAALTAGGLLRGTLLDAAMTANPAYWDTDQMRRWMDVLVERQYPWFVCSVWTRHRTEAISLLHASSLTHHHTSYHRCTSPTCTSPGVIHEIG